MARILIVDDEESIVEVLGGHLSNMGHEIAGAAHSGRDAVDQARRLRPDIIFMDIMMPGEMDGIEAAKAIKDELDIPVLFLSAFSEDHIVEKAKHAEPFGYLVKPFDASQIRAAVEVALHKKALEREKAKRDREDAWKEVATLAERKLEDLKVAEEEPPESASPSRSTWVLIVALMLLVLLMMSMAVVQVIFKH